MRQEQIQRRRQRSNPPDDTPDDMPTETPEHASKALRDASDTITRITEEIGS